jgi:hypothetical protein
MAFLFVFIPWIRTVFQNFNLEKCLLKVPFSFGALAHVEVDLLPRLIFKIPILMHRSEDGPIKVQIKRKKQEVLLEVMSVKSNQY